MSEVADSTGAAASVEFYGERFALNSDVSEFAVMEFAEAASSGADGDTMEGLAVLLRFVTELIAEGDRGRFRVVARKNRATVEALTDLLTQSPGERPTVAPSDSSGGRTDTEQKSGSNSGDKASLRPGRPDLALVMEQARSA